MIWRLFGVKIGKRVYDGGLNMPEKTLVTIGDDCSYEAAAGIPKPSMESRSGGLRTANEIATGA